jgi:uroporphyrin-III C-methyltransferase/precorrin-2 dehydrogenase/sirohydrochlorin ferrochelatase
MSSQHFASPSIVIIGRVVSLQEQFAWIENSSFEGNYFPSPLLNKIKTYQPENLFKHAI